MLSASMGYAFDEDTAMEDAAAVVNESPAEDTSEESEEPVAPPVEPAPAEQVGQSFVLRW